MIGAPALILLAACGGSPPAATAPTATTPAAAAPATAAAAPQAPAAVPAAAAAAPQAPAAVPAAAAAAPTPATPRAVPEATIQPLLQPGERLAHAPFATGLGTSPKLTLAVVEKDGRLGSFTVDDAGARTDGPALTTEWQLFEVPAVMFLQADDKDGVDAVVLATCVTGIGPEGAVPFPCNAALTWSGGLVRLPEVEARVAKATKAAEVRAALGRP